MRSRWHVLVGEPVREVHTYDGVRLMRGAVARFKREGLKDWMIVRCDLLSDCRITDVVEGDTKYAITGAGS